MRASTASFHLRLVLRSRRFSRNRRPHPDTGGYPVCSAFHIRQSGRARPARRPGRFRSADQPAQGTHAEHRNARVGHVSEGERVAIRHPPPLAFLPIKRRHIHQRRNAVGFHRRPSASPPRWRKAGQTRPYQPRRQLRLPSFSKTNDGSSS